MKLESFKFQDGKVFWLPEYPEWPKYLEDSPLWNRVGETKHKEAVAQSLASAIEVAPEDAQKVKRIIWWKDKSPDPLEDWQPENGKVYSAECEMEIEYYFHEDGIVEVGWSRIGKTLYDRYPNSTLFKKEARLKLKDEKAGRPEDFPWPVKESENVVGKWRVESSTSPIADTGDYFTQLWLTNGIVNLHSEKDDNETELQLIADQLNKDEIPAANSHDMKDEDL